MLLIATGADYRKLGVEGCDWFEGRGVYYALPSPRANSAADRRLSCRGGNSAGQAAVFLSGQARQVLLLVRGDDLYKNMSSYLAKRIEQTPNIELLYNTTIRRMNGATHLESVTLSMARQGGSGP